MKNAMKRWLSLLLTVLMVASALPFAALAEGAAGLIEDNLVPVETEQPTETKPTVNVSNAVSPAGLLAAGEVGTLENDGISTATISGPTTVKVGGTITLTSDKNDWYLTHSWSSSNENVATVGENGATATVRGVSEGSVTITHGYREFWSQTWATETYAVTVSGTETGTTNTDDAQIFYLKTPASDPNSNSTSQWGRNVCEEYHVNGKVNTTGATWVDTNGYTAKNIFNPNPYVVSMAQYMTKESDGSWLLPKDKYGTDYTIIYNAYKAELENDLSVTLNSVDDIEAIYLVPYKISRNNDSTPDKHIDCTISVKTASFYVAKFWVTLPDGNRNQVDAENYRQGTTVEKTTVAPKAGTQYPAELEYDGLKLVFDGWYNEAEEKVSDSQWPYTPSEAELADGTVNFEARYVPAETYVTVTKTVSSDDDADMDREFTFNYTVNGEPGQSFTLKNGQQKSLIVSIGETLVVTETANNAFTTTYLIDGRTSGDGTSATIQSVAGVGHTIAFTNTRALTSVTATKVWSDEENKYGIRPGSITLQLMANGTASGSAVPVTADASGNWSYTWTDLQKFDANGTAITYTVTETAVPGYTSAITGDAANGFTVTNTLETTSVTAEKVWSDEENKYGFRPDSVTLQLKSNDTSFGDPVTVTADTSGKWSYVWENLPKYGSDGNVVVYTVEEIDVSEKYTPSYSVVDGKLIVTNTLKTHTLTIKKQVEGNMGSWNKQFAFTTNYGDGDKTANLAHDKTAVYTAVPYGATVTVTENPDGYTLKTIAVEPTTVTKTDVDNGASFTMPDEDVTIIFTNDNEAEVDTGILLDSLPYVLILALVAVALVVWFARRRRDD